MKSLVNSHLEIIRLVNHELTACQETESEDNQLLERIATIVLENGGD